MESYIHKLIEHLFRVQDNPSTKPYDEVLLFMEDDPADVEHSLVAYKSIEEWSGIKKSVVPGAGKAERHPLSPA